MSEAGALLWLLAIDRERAMLAAFASLAGAGVIVSIGAWILLLRQRHLEREDRRWRDGRG